MFTELFDQLQIQDLSFHNKITSNLFPNKLSIPELQIEVQKKLGHLLTDDQRSELIPALRGYVEDKKRNFQIQKRVDKKNVILKSVDHIDLDRKSSKLVDEYLQSLIPISDSRLKGIHFYDPSNRELIPMDEDKYIAKKPLESKRELLAIAHSCRVEFNPLETKVKYTRSENGLIYEVFNLCKTPKWFSLTPTKLEIEDSLIWKLILNLFPESVSREYALCWLYHAITSRNHTYLCMVGVQGVGKGMFADLVSQLVGRQYWQKCDNAVLEEKFNSQFENSRVLFFDEVTVDETSKINKLKAFANSHISVESKGKDAKTIRNYTSCLMANNSMRGLQIGPEERRFSIVELGSKDLKHTMPHEHREILSEMLERDHEQDPHDEIINFGHWLLSNFKEPRYSNTYTFKGDYFYEVSRNGLAPWKLFLITLFENEFEQLTKPMQFTTLATKFKTYMGGDERIRFPANRVTEFLREYKYRDMYSMGEVQNLVIDNGQSSRIVQALFISFDFLEYLRSKNIDL